MILQINSLHILKYPSGRYGFVGKVPAILAYVTEAGDTPTVEQFRAAQIAGPRIAGLKIRAWETEQAARDAAEAIGAIVAAN